MIGKKVYFVELGTTIKVRTAKIIKECPNSIVTDIPLIKKKDTRIPKYDSRISVSFDEAKKKAIDELVKKELEVVNELQEIQDRIKYLKGMGFIE